ncbi:phosphatidylglycerophosphatase A family protein [Marinobacterium arenosum]|uniref:phosphatidylglycerophosphatase A family protein n=1 Tax=Marinobacterium arenosum TaxID=2862496 RepID=UPI001C9592D9|nr:phosphatidylglycerophosphatase A [Marinobacterium arenosum]MBY4675544.1 phosphatidylglycerophosphatase A [Marinobacterium arenosum]
MNKVPASVWRNPIHFLAFGLGSGASPWAPGTVGTLAAIIPYLWFAKLSLPLYLLMLVVTTLIGIWLCERTSRDIGVHDHGGIVWDEFVGFWLTMLAAPAGWQWIAIGFVLFRIFDILKPWPIRWADRKVHGGLGIMLDDLLAGVYAGLCLQLLAGLNIF